MSTPAFLISAGHSSAVAGDVAAGLAQSPWQMTVEGSAFWKNEIPIPARKSPNPTFTTKSIKIIK